MTYIYCLLDENFNPFYVGKTINDLKIRQSQHINKLNKKCYISELAFVEDKDWKFHEKKWIQQFKQWGFKLINKNEGGGGPDKGRILRKKDQEWKEKISKSKKGIKLSQETKDKISIARIGKSSNFKEHNHSDESKQKISNSHLKAIIQYTLKGEFIKEWNSAVEITKTINIPAGNIASCCTGNLHSCSGFIWKHKSNPLPHNFTPYINGKSRPCVQFDIKGNKIKEFNSAREADKYLNMSYGMVSTACNKNKHLKGFIWKWKAK